MLLCGCLTAYSTPSWRTFVTVEEEVVNKAAIKPGKKKKKEKKRIITELSVNKKLE